MDCGSGFGFCVWRSGGLANREVRRGFEGPGESVVFVTAWRVDDPGGMFE